MKSCPVPRHAYFEALWFGRAKPESNYPALETIRFPAATFSEFDVSDGSWVYLASQIFAPSKLTSRVLAGVSILCFGGGGAGEHGGGRTNQASAAQDIEDGVLAVLREVGSLDDVRAGSRKTMQKAVDRITSSSSEISIALLADANANNAPELIQFA